MRARSELAGVVGKVKKDARRSGPWKFRAKWRVRAAEGVRSVGTRWRKCISVWSRERDVVE